MENNQIERGTAPLNLSVLAKVSLSKTDQFLCLKSNLTRVFGQFAQSDCFATQSPDDRANYVDMFEVLNQVIDEVHLLELEYAEKVAQASKSNQNGRR